MKPCTVCKKPLSPIYYHLDENEKIRMIDYYCSDCDLNQSVFIEEKYREKAKQYNQGELNLFP